MRGELEQLCATHDARWIARNKGCDLLLIAVMLVTKSAIALRCRHTRTNLGLGLVLGMRTNLGLGLVLGMKTNLGLVVGAPKMRPPTSATYFGL